MTVDIAAVIREGVRKTTARNGLQLLGVTYVLLAVYALFVPVQTEFDPAAEEPMAAEPVLGTSASVGGLVGLLTMILSLYVAVVAYRTFASDETERIPPEATSERAVAAVANLVVGGLVFMILVTIGSIFFLIPGLFLLVSLWFFGIAIAVEGDNFVAGMRRSWGLTRGSRLELFGLGVVVFVLVVAISAAFGIPEVAIGGVVGLLIGQLGAAIAVVFMYATTAVAYQQLRDDDPAPGPESDPSDDPSTEPLQTNDPVP